jgi:hypothetical protein
MMTTVAVGETAVAAIQTMIGTMITQVEEVVKIRPVFVTRSKVHHEYLRQEPKKRNYGCRPRA